MKEKRIPVLIAAVLLLLITAAVAWEVAKRYIPSKEPADLNQVLGVEGEETAIFFNEELQKVKGITRDDQTYLPIDWVNDNLNEKFYWDNVEKLLVYTLPDTIVYADKRTMGSTGLPLLLVDADKVYLSVGLINNYTAVDMASYTNQEHKRIYLDNRWGTRLAGTVGRRSPVRVEADIKSPILTQVEKGAGLVVLEQSEQWSKVRTGDGHTGYVKSRAIARIDPQENPCVMKLPEYTSISMDEKVCLVWHQVTHESANEVMEELMENTKGVNVIAPTWFALTDNKGHYHSYASREYVDRAHDMGLQVWAALDNFNMGDNVNSEILFAQTSVRKSLIARLMEDVKTYNLDGINLDIESIKPEAGPHYVQFIRELSVSCRNEGVILSVDNYVPAGYNAFYNRAEQGRVVDYVIIMGYDEHFAGGEAGSVASYPFVKSGIENTLKLVPKEKVINAVPFFTRVWTENGDKTTSSALGLEGAAAWVEEKQVELFWDEDTGQSYGELETDEGLKRIWLEDAQSLELKMDLIRDYDLAGVACWKLGFEPSSIWDVVKVNE
ncbi:MAG: SH3 domain-containing protein [Hungatella sp.]|nr:SH3 domain-containing protein [Hungatella sp.]